MNLKRFFILLLTLLIALTGLLLYFSIRHGAWAFFIAEGALIISVITLLVFYKRIVKPIRTLSQGMDMLKMQDFSQRLRSVGQFEADMIADTFNSIIARLRNEQIHTQEQEHFLNLLINNSPSGIILLDGNNKIHIANNSAFDILGKDIIGKRIDDLSSPQGGILHNTKVKQTIILPTTSGQLFRCTHQTFMDSGYEHHFYILDDVTSEIATAQRTAYEKVIRMMSHEVNNTMTGILSTMQMLYDVAESNPQLNDFSESINASITRSSQLSKFISRIAQVVKIPDPILVPTDILSTLNDAVKFVCSESEQRNITISINNYVSSLTKGADAEMLQQAFINILRNAMESIDKNGEITIEINMNQIRITDNGQGIPPEIAQNLFRPFFTTKKGGQGIGLMLIAEILTKHGFKYSLTTCPQTHLTTFCINI